MWLAHAGDDGSRDVLIAHLLDEDTPALVQRECAYALGMIANERLRDALIAVRNTPSTSDVFQDACQDAISSIDSRSSG